MAAFGIYGVLVWWMAFRLRGSWRAYIPPVVGVLGIVAAGWLLGRMVDWTDGLIGPEATRSLQVLLYPYGALVGAIGVFIAWIPVQPVGRRDRKCHACLYDLTGLAAQDLVCPECGKRVLRPGEVGERE